MAKAPCIERTGRSPWLAVRMAYANRRSGGPFFERSRLFRISCSICSRERPRAAVSASALILAVKKGIVA
jgi:hypothetical protein